MRQYDQSQSIRVRLLDIAKARPLTATRSMDRSAFISASSDCAQEGHALYQVGLYVLAHACCGVKENPDIGVETLRADNGGGKYEVNVWGFGVVGTIETWASGAGAQGGDQLLGVQVIVTEKARQAIDAIKLESGDAARVADGVMRNLLGIVAGKGVTRG